MRSQQEIQEVLGFRARREMRLVAHACGVVGCANTTTAGRYCRQCQDELAGIQEYWAERERRARARALRFAAVMAAVKTRLWIVNLAVLLLGIAVMSIACSDAVMQWIGAR